MADEELVEEELTTEQEIAMLNYLEGKGLMDRGQQKDNMVSMFKKIFNAKNTTKASNLTSGNSGENDEVGAMNRILDASKISEIFKYPLIEEYLTSKAEIIAGVSLGRKAKFLDSLQTERKLMKGKIGNSNKKKSFFSRPQPEED